MTQSILSNSNIENSTNETYFDTLLQNKNFNVDKRNVNFSKLVDNVSAKTNQVQTKFVSSAVKSNTSSINKKVLENKTQAKTTEKTTPKQKKLDFTSDVKKTLNSNIQNKPSNNSVDLSSDKTTAQKTFVNKENTSNEFISDTDSAKISVNASTEENATETNNISSPVSSSPVIFFEAGTELVENSTVENDADIEALDAIALVNVVPEVKVYTVEDLSSEIDEFVSDSQIDENTLNAIEKVVSVVEQNNLSQQTNDNLQDLLAKLKQNMADKTDTTDDINLKAEIKEVFNDILSEVSQYSKTEEATVNENISAEVPLTETKVDTDEIKSDLVEIKNALEDIVKDTKLQDKELGEVLDEINVVIENTDENDKISTEEFLDNIKSLKEKLENLKQTISKTEDKQTETSDNTVSKETKTKIDVDVDDSKVKKLNEKVSALQNKISDYVEGNTPAVDSAELKNTDTKSDIDLSNKTKTQQADDSNQKLISEIVNILKNSESKTDSDEIVLDSQTEKTIVVPENASKDTVSDNVETQQFTKEQNEFSQNSKNIQDDILKTARNDSDKKSSEDSKIVLNKSTQQTDNFENNTTDYDSEFSQNQDTDTIEVEMPETDSVTTNTQSDSKQEIADIFKKEKLDLIEDITFGNDFSESGALSVSDEIAKIAMNTNSSTNLNNMHLGQNENLIKNISFEKTLQQSQNIQSKIESSNIFNQINEKLQNFGTNNSQRLTMVLRPQDLGRLSIELMSNDKGLTTNILVQNADVRKYIEKNIDGLRQQLANAGVNVNTIQIKTAGESGTSTFEGNQNQSNQQNESDSAFKNNQNTNQDSQKRDKNEYLANADYDSFFSKNTNDDFSSVLNNTFNYMLN